MTDLRTALSDRVLVADGAMGTMLQGFDLSLDDFQGLEGCNEVLNVTRPDVVTAIHAEYLAAGADCIETNTFGANLAALGEYDIPDRIAELAGAGARLARAAADAASADRPRYVLGIEPTTNTVTVGPHEALAVRRIDGIRPTWAEAEVLGSWRGLVQVRAHGAALPAWIEGRTESITVLLDDATHGIAPGQAVVCYDGDRVVGSATIAATAR